MAQGFLSTRLPDALLFQVELSHTKPLTAVDVMARVATGDCELEDFRPLPHNLEWRLSALHWIRTGVTPFITDDVPYLVNNNGRASTAAAAVFFENCLEAPADQPIRVLEVGAGSALFARYFSTSFGSSVNATNATSTIDWRCTSPMPRRAASRGGRKPASSPATRRT